MLKIAFVLILSFFLTNSTMAFAQVPITTAGGKSCGAGNKSGIETAIGCVHIEPVAFVEDLIKLSMGISGGIAFLLMLFGVFQMITSVGNAEALKAGQERFFNAIIGLLFIIFSILLLQIIGVNILKIPGF